MRRALIYAHYNQHNSLAGYVLYTLQAMRPSFDYIVMVSNSGLKENDKLRIETFVDKNYERENSGYDFGAWKDAIYSEGWEKLAAYDSLTLMNDTCFGPIYDLQAMLSSMECKNYDFWGLTNYHNKVSLKTILKRIAGRTRPIKNHLQSYFLYFNKRVVKSQEFMDFWGQLRYHDHVLDVIMHYEEKLTALIASAGFNWGSYIDTRQIKSKHDNLSIFHPDQLLIRGAPFIKVKSFFYNDNPKELLSLIEQKSDYNTELIREHLNEVF